MPYPLKWLMSIEEDPRYKAWRDGSKSYKSKVDSSSSSYYANLDSPQSSGNLSEGYSFLAIGAVIFLIIGGLFSYADIFLLDKYKEGQGSKDWPTVTGTITISYIEKTRDSESDTTYSLYISYVYSIDEVLGDATTLPYIYNNSDIGSWGASSEWGHSDPYMIGDYLEKFPLGAEVPVYYNPESHQVSVLEPGVSGILYFLLFLVNLILLGLFLGLIVAPIYYIKNDGI